MGKLLGLDGSLTETNTKNIFDYSESNENLQNFLGPALNAWHDQLVSFLIHSGKAILFGPVMMEVHKCDINLITLAMRNLVTCHEIYYTYKLKVTMYHGALNYVSKISISILKPRVV